MKALRFVLVVAAVLAIIALPIEAQAQSPHLVRATTSVSGSAVFLTAKYAGLGSEQTYTGTVLGSGTVQWNCRNPGGHVVEPHSGTASFSGAASGTAARSGNLTLTYTLTISPAPSCPNPNWTVQITGGSISATLALSGPSVSLSNTCSGPIPGRLSC